MAKKVKIEAKCSICGKVFEDRRGLSGHLRFVHEKVSKQVDGEVKKVDVANVANVVKDVSEASLYNYAKLVAEKWRDGDLMLGCRYVAFLGDIPLCEFVFLEKYGVKVLRWRILPNDKD